MSTSTCYPLYDLKQKHDENFFVLFFKLCCCLCGDIILELVDYFCGWFPIFKFFQVLPSYIIVVKILGFVPRFHKILPKPMTPYLEDKFDIKGNISYYLTVYYFNTCLASRLLAYADAHIAEALVYECGYEDVQLRAERLKKEAEEERRKKDSIKQREWEMECRRRSMMLRNKMMEEELRKNSARLEGMLSIETANEKIRNLRGNFSIINGRIVTRIDINKFL